MNIAALTANMYSDDSELNSILKNDKTNFYKHMKELGFDFDDLDKETKTPKSMIPVLAGNFDAILSFNNALLTLHKKKYVNIADALIYLNDDYFVETDIKKIIQTNVLGIAYAELSTRHKLFSIPASSHANKFIHLYTNANYK